jgi:hypothetical protein
MNQGVRTIGNAAGYSDATTLTGMPKPLEAIPIVPEDDESNSNNHHHHHDYLLK